MKLLNSEQKEVENLDFGRVEAGHTKTYEYYLFNDTDVENVNIEVSVYNEEVKVLTYPKELKSGQKGKLEISWSPSITLKKGLTAVLNINRIELYK